jgi:hypothetical protein
LSATSRPDAKWGAPIPLVSGRAERGPRNLPRANETLYAIAEGG